MTAPITPDERAAMRARYPAGPIHESGLFAMGMRALDDVPCLLGALDAAEAEVARLCGPHPCCEHCAEDPVHDVAPGEHEMPCTSCEADTLLGRVRRERDAALAEVERLTAEVQERDEWLHETAALLPEGFDGDEWEGEVIARFIRQAARPAPAWDEDAKREGAIKALRDAAAEMTELGQEEYTARAVSDWLSGHADRLAAEGGADRG